MKKRWLSDFLCRLNNAKIKNLQSIYVKNNEKVIMLLKILLELNIVTKFVIINSEFIEVYLKYKSGVPVFYNMRLVSKYNKNIYLDMKKLLKYKEKSEITSVIYIISTIKGLCYDIDCLQHKLSGEVLFCIEF